MGTLSRIKIIEKVRDAGVVGAGGAGFPTHIKMDCNVDTLIVNIAECEPLICKDKEIVRNFPKEVIHAAELMMVVSGAQQAFFALKKKHDDIAHLLESHLKKGMFVSCLADYYPAGDEILLSYDVTGAVIPEGALPVSKGILVSNAETLLNISRAMNSEPVTEKHLTITGALEHPLTVKAPVGMVLQDLLNHYGIRLEAHVPFADGAMMGELVDYSMPITRTTAGILLLPEDHPLVRKRRRTVKQDIRIIKSACDQCSYCTEYCPRYLLGHRVEPHRIMRSLSLSQKNGEYPPFAKGCVSCSLCTLFACPEELSPDIVMKEAKKQQTTNTPPNVGKIHPMREFRKVSGQKLTRRLSLDCYDKRAPLEKGTLTPNKVLMPLAQHTGPPSHPLKAIGDGVRSGETIALPAKNVMGTAIHASIGGTVTAIAEGTITIEQNM